MKKWIAITALGLASASVALICANAPAKTITSACACCNRPATQISAASMADNQKTCPGSSCRCSYSDFWKDKKTSPAGKDCYGKNCGQKGSWNPPKN